MSKWRCDRCGVVAFVPVGSAGEDVRPENWGDLVEADLCQPCYAAFHNWLKYPTVNKEPEHA